MGDEVILELPSYVSFLESYLGRRPLIFEQEMKLYFFILSLQLLDVKQISAEIHCHKSYHSDIMIDKLINETQGSRGHFNINVRTIRLLEY